MAPFVLPDHAHLFIQTNPSPLPTDIPRLIIGLLQEPVSAMA
jgi:hypothetical protein